MNRRTFCVSAVGIQASLAFGDSLALFPAPHLLPAQEIVLDNVLDHPLYFWPKTLLNYPVSLPRATDPTQFYLRCIETGELQHPQFTRMEGMSKAGSDGYVMRFLSDLPASTRRTFRLERKASTLAQTQKLTAHVGEASIVLDCGPMQVRIPATQIISGTAPGPIMQVCRGGRWAGSSKLVFPRNPVIAVTTECIEQGDLFQSYRVRYSFEGGYEYLVTLDCTAGIDYVRMQEDMTRIPPGVGGLFELRWDGCDFTHRQFPNHPYPFPGNMPAGHTFEDYPWEPIGQRETNSHLGVIAPKGGGEMSSRLGVFEPWPAFGTGSFATFWDERGGDAASIFIDRPRLWRDPDYPIWTPSARLCVRFALEDGALVWRWPLEIGGRSTCISFYDHQKDKEVMSYMEKNAPARPDGEPYGNPGGYGMFLQNRYGTVHLDEVKDWQLTYDGERPPVIFGTKSSRDADELERRILGSEVVRHLMLTGTRQNGGYGPVPMRQVLDYWISDFNQFSASMTVVQRRRLTAHLLIQAYVCAGEDFMPMIPMLSGHPNFLADVKSTPVGMAFLFPRHPQAESWVEEYDRFIALNSRYHTRPAVQQWGALGGRWTENLGTYVWGFIRPSIRADYLAGLRDGEEHFLSPQIVEVGDWLVNALSAPFDGETEVFYKTLDLRDAHLWGVVAPHAGPRRIHPPMGAHAERRKTPRMMWYVGTALLRYAPLAAEHLLWASRPEDQDQEQLLNRPDVWQMMYRKPANRGTNPHLRSSKFTGFGITLRAAVDTPEELSIHLLQIDDGPNYRWGVPGEGGCGLVYFVAGGKSYSHNGKEDEGDRFVHDTDLGTNFGVWKNGRYVSIGQNVLSAPLYDLGIAQQAELLPRSGDRSYSAPEYVKRRVLLAGDDYFVLYDQVFNLSVGHRFSWFVQRGDAFPAMTFVRGFDPRDASALTILETATTKGKWFDGRGDSMVVITHKKDVVAEATPYGCKVLAGETEDLVFMNPTGVEFMESGIGFKGTSGIVRHRGQRLEIALFHGTEISAGGITFRTQDTKLGLSAVIVSTRRFSGRCFAPNASSMQIFGVDPASHLYLDGVRADVSRSGEAISVALMPGQYRWEITDGLPKPLAPDVDRTEYRDGGALVHATPVSAASQYRFEHSGDGGASWLKSAVSEQPSALVTGLENGRKYHVRTIALNADHESDPGREYPLYITKDSPPSPSGLSTELEDGRVALTWGDVLGVSEYRLYKREKGRQAWTELWRGADRHYRDRDKRIRAAEAMPGETQVASKETVLEYCIASVNANGEGSKSRPANTDSSSWRNTDFKSGERFRRANTAGSFGIPPNDGWGFYYPEP